MKIFIYALFSSVIIFACNTKNESIERISLSPQIINDSLFTMLPGKILLCEPYVIWQDGFATDTFMHVIDLRTGKEVGKMGKIGRGPEEFISPNPIGCINKHIIVLDDNLSKCAFYSIDSLLSSRNPYIPLTDFPVKQVCDAVVVDSSSFIVLQFMTPSPFHFIKSDRVVSKFGKLPISDSITNSYATLQGTLAYNPEKHVMLYSANRFPYFALYRKNTDNSFSLAKESTYPIHYTIEEKKAKLSKNKTEAFRNPIFTKNYLVFRKQDEQNPLPKQKPTPGIRDLSMAPHTIYIFDYQLNLLKIADLNMPILQITANSKDDTLYILGLKDSYCIAKCKIE